MQNNLKELFNLMSFLQLKEFKKYDHTVTLETMTEEQVTELRASLRPHILRRLKVEVFKGLPQKKEILVPTTLTRVQKEYYQAVYTRNYALLQSAASVRAPALTQSSFFLFCFRFLYLFFCAGGEGDQKEGKQGRRRRLMVFPDTPLGSVEGRMGRKGQRTIFQTVFFFSS